MIVQLFILICSIYFVFYSLISLLIYNVKLYNFYDFEKSSHLLCVYDY